MRRAIACFALAAGLAGAGGLGRAEATGALEVERLWIRFGPPVPGIETFAATSLGRVRMEAMLPASLQGGFDPAADVLRVEIGGVRMVDGPDFPGMTRVAVERDGALRVRGRRCYDERGGFDLRLDLVGGRLALDARAMDIGRLLGQGPEGVAVTVQVRDEVLEASCDMDEHRGALWTYGPRRVPLLPPAERPSVIASGEYAPFEERFAEVIRDGEALRALFQRLGARPEDGDAVDFERETVIAVGLGSRPSGGYSVRVVAVEPRGEGVAVLVRESRPGDDCIVTLAVTQPWTVVRVPRFEGEASFRGEVVIDSCRPAR